MAIVRNFKENIIEIIGPNSLNPGDEGYIPFNLENGDYVRVIVKPSTGSTAPDINYPEYSSLIFLTKTIVNSQGVSTTGTAQIENSQIIDESGNSRDFTLFEDGVGNFYIKPNDILDTLEATEGEYILQFDFMNKLSVSDENFIVRELSPSRLEIRLKLEESYITEEDSFKNDFISAITDENDQYKFNYILNVNNLKNVPIVNYTFDHLTNDINNQSIILKLYEPTFANVLQTVTIEKEVLITQTQTIWYKGAPDRFFYGTGLEIDNNLDAYDIDDFSIANPQSYNELTSSFTDLSTLNQLVTSSHEYPNLNIDFQHFKNHVFYGSAKQKLINFREKVAKIESQYHAISQSLSVSASIQGTGDNSALITHRKELFDKVQQELNLFTPYEKWMYYDGQSSATSSAPSIGNNYSNIYALNRDDLGTNVQPYSSVTESLDGFKQVYTINKNATNKAYLTKNNYRVEESPLFNFSGSVYVSFLIKDGVGGGTGDFAKVHFEVDTEKYNGYYTPSASIHNEWLSQPTINSGSWRRYIGLTSASYWYPHEDAEFNTSYITEQAFNNPNVEQNRIRILSGSQHTKTGSALIKTQGAYQNISTVNTASGQTGFEFSGSVMPTGDIIRLILPDSGLGQENPSTVISHSFVTDFKVTLTNPSDTYPFAQMFKTGSTTFDNWYDGAYDSASKFDEDNIHSLINNLPLYIQESTEYEDMKKFIQLIGEQFDIIRNHVDQYKTIYNRNYDKFDSVPPNLLPIIGESLGWNFIQPYTSSVEHPLAEHFGQSLSRVTDTKDLTEATWRKTLNNLMYIYKSKGTKSAVRALLNTYGYPPEMVRISEFGGSSQEHNPAVITDDLNPMTVGLRRENDNVSYIERKKKLFNYILRASGSSDRTIKSDWWARNANANTVEFIYKHSKGVSNQELLMSSGSATASLWDLRLLSSTDTLSSSFEFRLNTSTTGSLDIPRHAVSMSTDYTVMDEGSLWNVMLQRVSSSVSGSGTNEYKLAVALQDRDTIPILNAVSMSISGGLTVDANHNANKNWPSTGSRHFKSGSNLYIGRTISGSIAEFRAWSTALSSSKFKQHVLNKFSVVGNDNTAHKDELIYHYRLNENWVSSSSDVRIIDANPNGPLNNPTKYDVSMSLDLTTNSQLYAYDMVDVYTFSLRGNTENQENNNKIIINPEQSLIGNLNPFNSSTKELYKEQSAARKQNSNKLEMTTGPSNFINDFILNNLPDYDTSKLFGNPENEFSGSYEELDKFRKDFFDNYDISINTSEFIRSNESLYTKNVIDTVKQMTPARSTMTGDGSVGIIIEPNILEKTKIKNHKLSLQSGNVGINDLEDILPISTPTTGSLIQLNQSSIDLSKDTLIDVSLIATSSYQPSRNVTLSSPITSSGFYDSTKDAPIDSTLKTLLSYEETKNVEFGSPVTSSGFYDSTKNVTIESPLSESFNYEPIRDTHLGSPVTSSMNYESEKNIELNIEEEIVESATYEETKNVELGSPLTESISYEKTKNIYFNNPISESADYDSTKNVHMGSPLTESLSYEETKKITLNINEEVNESAIYEETKNIELGSPISESLVYEPEKNINLNIQERVSESADYESVKDIHLGSIVSESFTYESVKNTKIGTPIKESADYETIKNVHVGSSITESIEYHKTKNIELDDFYTETATLQTTIDEHFSFLPNTTGSQVELPIEGLSGSTADHINTNSTAPFRDLINEWGTGIGDTHFINYAAEEETGSRDFNLGHIESRFTFTMVGDTEVVSGSVNSVGDYEIDFTNKKHFYNRLIVDNESSMYRTSQPAPLYHSYFGTGSGVIEGRMMGKTSYFSASADGGWITYPSNHWSNFSRPFTDKMYEGTKNVNPGFFNLVEWEDYSSASFYRVTVTGDTEAVINDGNPTLDEDGNII